ncbi:MAG: hypothetical protein ACRYGF_06790 [Janthinobacterium lividum]
MAKIEMMEVLVEDAVVIDTDNGPALINPLAQTPDNFAQMRYFINRVAALLCAQID